MIPMVDDVMCERLRNSKVHMKASFKPCQNFLPKRGFISAHALAMKLFGFS